MDGAATLRVPLTAPAVKTPHEGARALRNALGRFATGVTVIATECPQGRVHGMTVNSFTSLSLDPALILWTLRTGSARFATFSRCERFSVNVLAENQAEIARRYARASAGALAAHWRVFRSGCPVLEDVSAQFVCRSRSTVLEGDHAILIGEVIDFVQLTPRPLLFLGGGYYSASALRPL